MIGDVERIDWLEQTAAELKLTICYSESEYYEVWIGQVCVSARTLREALDDAIQVAQPLEFRKGKG